MGLMDFVRSSYDLGEEFTNTRCQTKSIENLMNDYWISPDGVLYEIDYSYTADFVELKEGDDGYDERAGGLFNFVWIPNGTRGRVKPHPITKYIEIYPETWDGKWEDWPVCRIHFKCGKLVNYEILTKINK